MTQVSKPSEDSELELEIPSEWRKSYLAIIISFIEGDFLLSKCPKNIRRLSAVDGSFVKETIEEYGDQVALVPDDGWATSVCRWMGDHWFVIIDLFTVNEMPSDLALFARVYEEADEYIFEVSSVHVP